MSEGRVREGDDLEIEVPPGRITNRATGETFRAVPFPPFMQELMPAGGLVAYTRRRLGLD